MFQSTHPVGCDQRPRRKFIKVIVSIHASRGMRRNACADNVASNLFQSTHPVGCDFLYCQIGDVPDMFQSTHPVGCDVELQKIMFFLYGFNPRIPWDATLHVKIN